MVCFQTNECTLHTKRNQFFPTSTLTSHLLARLPKLYVQQYVTRRVSLEEFKVRYSDITLDNAAYSYLLPGTGTTQPGQPAGSPAAAFAAAQALTAGTGNGLVQNGVAPQAQQQAGQGQQAVQGQQQAGQGQQQAGQGQQAAQGQQQQAGMYTIVISAVFSYSNACQE
jgi:hypothetical protein